MMTNNINEQGMFDFEKVIYDDLINSTKHTTLSGEWNFNDEVGQFKALIKSEFGNAIMIADNMIETGGFGVNPDPLQYFLFGVASGYASVLTRRAALDNCNIDSLSVSIDAETNYDRFFGIDDISPVKKLIMLVKIKTSVSPEKIRELGKNAFNCCPSLYLINKDIDIKINFIINN